MRCGLNYSGQGFCPLNIEIAQFPGGFHLNLFWNDCLCMAIVVFKEDYLHFSFKMEVMSTDLFVQTNHYVKKGIYCCYCLSLYYIVHFHKHFPFQMLN